MAVPWSVLMRAAALRFSTPYFQALRSLSGVEIASVSSHTKLSPFRFSCSEQNGAITTFPHAIPRRGTISIILFSNRRLSELPKEAWTGCTWEGGEQARRRPAPRL